ncbi:ribosomal protein S27-domain-containing protein [Lophiotrema nucula]|uniref:40S ribosomal protein S27 n=1 Tax=Lophiotrema nucula TaxID=690887 RepID=A0A6A5YSU5_9PLEO|nr:ribosomal protein S27-domain-containing protein [Lophiotrema nucula]
MSAPLVPHYTIAAPVPLHIVEASAFWMKEVDPIAHPEMMPMKRCVLAVDLLNPTPAAEARKHKLKTLVPAPRSFFMDVKCPGCFTITTVFSHANTVVVCQGCSQVLCQPTGGKARLTEGCSFRRK